MTPLIADKIYREGWHLIFKEMVLILKQVLRLFCEPAQRQMIPLRNLALRIEFL